MLYALLAISVVLLIAVIVLFIFVYKNSCKSQINGVSDKDLGALSQQIKSLENDLRKDIELSLAKEMVSVNEKNNEKLERFQSNII